MKEATGTEREQLIKELREWMPAGTTVYTILRSVSRSGMSRVISPVFFYGAKVEPLFPEYKVAKLMGWSLARDQGIKENPKDE